MRQLNKEFLTPGLARRRTMKPIACQLAALVLACTMAQTCRTTQAKQDAEPTAVPIPLAKDRYSIKIALETAQDGAQVGAQVGAAAPIGGGRLLLFFVPDTDRWANSEPVDAPFFYKLQPIASIAVADGSALTTFTIDDSNATVFGGPLNGLSGAWRVQAVLDTDFTERGHLGPGNLVSEPKRIELAPDRADEIRIELVHRIAPAASKPAPIPGVEWVTRPSALLSKHFAREYQLRAGVVLPFGYDDLSFARRMWPTIYVIGGFGATYIAAADAAAALRAPEARGAIPQAVWVFLDCETAWGHHGFCDSPTNGPVGRALVEEFIPFLEERFRLIAKPEARIVTGHSSGGWTSLHLILSYPDTFGACFASAPDPVDFSAFQRTNLYRDASLFIAGDGSDTPSFRGPLGPDEDRVFMTVRDEMATERTIDPNGRSGEQWAAWNAMWSPYDPATGAPRRLCDPTTGAIDPVTVEAWSQFDLAKRLERDPARVSELFATRIRLICGARDSFYLNEAVVRLKEKLAVIRAAAVVRGEQPAEGPGFIEILDGLTHDTAHPAAQLRFHRGMVDHLRAHGLGEAPPRSSSQESAPAAKP